MRLVHRGTWLPSWIALAVCPSYSTTKSLDSLWRVYMAKLCRAVSLPESSEVLVMLLALTSIAMSSSAKISSRAESFARFYKKRKKQNKAKLLGSRTQTSILIFFWKWSKMKRDVCRYLPVLLLALHKLHQISHHHLLPLHCLLRAAVPGSFHLYSIFDGNTGIIYIWFTMEEEKDYQ